MQGQLEMSLDVCNPHTVLVLRASGPHPVVEERPLAPSGRKLAVALRRMQAVVVVEGGRNRTVQAQARGLRIAPGDMRLTASLCRRLEQISPRRLSREAAAVLGHRRPEQTVRTAQVPCYCPLLHTVDLVERRTAVHRRVERRRVPLRNLLHGPWHRQRPEKSPQP